MTVKKIEKEGWDSPRLWVARGAILRKWSTDKDLRETRETLNTWGRIWGETVARTRAQATVELQV